VSRPTLRLNSRCRVRHEKVERQRDDNQANQCWCGKAHDSIVASKLVDNERANLVCNVFKAVYNLLKMIV